MDELVLTAIVKNTAIFISVVGILTGLDLLLGVRGISYLKKILDRAIDIDKIVINTKGRVVLGVFFMVI